jgi:hypothetical protein
MNLRQLPRSSIHTVLFFSSLLFPTYAERTHTNKDVGAKSRAVDADEAFQFKK